MAVRVSPAHHRRGWQRVGLPPLEPQVLPTPTAGSSPKPCSHLGAVTVFLEWGGTSGPLSHAKLSHPNAHPMALKPYPLPSL